MADNHLRTSAAHGDLMQEGRIAVRGIELAYFEWGRRTGPTILMLHATGFHARCWDGVIRALGTDTHVIAVDQRGHGRSSKQGPYNWSEFGADAAAFVDALELENIVGVGHSMGGHSIVQAAGRHPGRFRALLLVDPVILDPAWYSAPAPFRCAEDHPVARRRNRWSSPEDMYERFKHRQPFSLWVPEVLMDYCRFGVVREGDSFVLGCPPEVEASIYLGSAGQDIRPTIAALGHPVVVLRAKPRNASDNGGGPEAGAMDFTRSPTWEGLAAALPNGRDVYLPGLTHFMPMQKPDLVADYIRELTQPSA